MGRLNTVAKDYASIGHSQYWQQLDRSGYSDTDMEFILRNRKLFDELVEALSCRHLDICGDGRKVYQRLRQTLLVDLLKKLRESHLDD